MTSPRDDDVPAEVVAAAEGIHKEWRTVTTGPNGFVGYEEHLTEDAARRSARAVNRLKTWASTVEFRHVTAWRPDPGVGVAQPDGEAGQRTPTPATPDFPAEWIVDYGSGVDL